MGSPAKESAHAIPRAQVLSFGSFTATVDPLEVSLGSFTVGSAPHVHVSSSSSPELSSVQSAEQQPPCRVLFPKPALKKSCSVNSLKSGSSPVGTVNDIPIYSDDNGMISLNSV
jgi:hypothetical protein